MFLKTVNFHDSTPLRKCSKHEDPFTIKITYFKCFINVYMTRFCQNNIASIQFFLKIMSRTRKMA